MRAPRSLVLLIATGCAVDAAPEDPSWQVDVMPVLAASCVRCHGYPQANGAPTDFRLDAFGTTTLAAGIDVSGASKQHLLVSRVTGPVVPFGKLPMPPRGPLGEREYAVLRNWSALARSETSATRGPGRPDNQAPSVTVTEVGRDGMLIRFSYEVRDADRDLVVGSVLGPRLNRDGQLGVGVVGDLTSGRGTFTWDTTGVAAGRHPLTAQLDDGADVDGPEGDVDFVEVPAVTVELAPRP